MLNLKTQIRASLSLIPMLLLPVSSGFGAATPTIGVATANGRFSLNHASHRNNATLFEGNTFDSGTSELEFRLVDGTIVQLGASARGNVFANHILIVDGGGDIHADATYPVEALGLQIESTQKGSVARVVVSGGKVQVGALRGELKVSNSKGILLAKIAQGQGDAFTPAIGTAQAAGAAGAAAGAAGVAGAAGASGVIAAGTVAAGGLSTTMIVAGVAIVSVGAAAGITVASSSGNSELTLSPSVR